MKLLIRIFLLLVSLGCFVLQPSFAVASPQTTVTFVNVNDKEYFDVEIMQVNNDKFLLPVKQLADILEIPLTINHSTKDLTFGDIKITKNDVFKNGLKISTGQNKYLQKGMMDDVRDEIFCDEKILSQIFNTKISLNTSDLSIYIVTDKDFSRTVDEKDDNKPKDEKPYKAYSEIEIPKEKKKITLDTVSIDNSMMTDTAAQVYQHYTDKNYTLNNNSRISLKGRVYDGDYNVDFATNNYQQKLFSFSGLSFKYKNQYKGMHYEVGKVSGFKDENYQIGTQLIGAQIFDYNPEPFDYRNVSGTVAQTSLVNVYVDGELRSTLNTYKGYYSLSDFYVNTDIKKLELKEVKADGGEEVIFTKEYPAYKNETGDGLLAKEKRRTFFAGISGFNDRLFSQDGYIYQMNTKKLVLGARQQYALRDNLILDTKMMYDEIITKSEDNIWAENYYRSNSILSMGTYRNPNVLHGMTVLNSLKYNVNDNWLLKGVMGISRVQNISQSDSEYQGGYSFALNSEYKKERAKFNVGVYNQSPNFYLAGSEFGFISDRIGTKIGGEYSFKDWHVSGSYDKYYSNLEKKYDAGLTGFDEVNFNLSGRIANLAQIRYNFNGRKGANDIGETTSYYHDLNISKNFTNGISLEAGRQESYYATDYFNVSDSNNGFSSVFSTLYTKARIPVMKNKGVLELGHDCVSYLSNNLPNDYNMIKVGYMFPEMKRFLLSVGAGYRYSGVDKGLNYNATLGYRMKTGMVVSLGYQFNTNGGYIIDNMYIPSNARHSINLTINDTFAVMPSGLKSVGSADGTKGFVEVVAYLDKNNNNIYDEGDIGVENVPIRLSWLNDALYTDKLGKIPVAVADSGVYKVSLDNEKLNANLSCAKNSKDTQLVLVKAKQQTNVGFKLVSSVGNIKGNLKIIDDFGRNLPIKDFIVVLHDKDDREVAYSTVDSQSGYYFSGIAPGDYTLMLDDSFVQEYSLSDYDGKSKLPIEIPFVYKDFVDINDQNLVYRSW